MLSLPFHIGDTSLVPIYNNSFSSNKEEESTKPTSLLHFLKPSFFWNVSLENIYINQPNLIQILQTTSNWLKMAALLLLSRLFWFLNSWNQDQQIHTTKTPVHTTHLRQVSLYTSVQRFTQWGLTTACFDPPLIRTIYTHYYLEETAPSVLGLCQEEMFPSSSKISLSKLQGNFYQHQKNNSTI